MYTRNSLLRAAGALGLLSTLALTPNASASGGLSVQDVSATLTASDLAGSLVGSGVSISNVTHVGGLDTYTSRTSAGKFSGGTGIIGFEEGIILSSGAAADVVGPNVEDEKTGFLNTGSDADLSTLSGNYTVDKTVLEFDFVPTKDKVFFEYVFASDEYNEYVNSPYNDVFGFFVNGTNCAVVGEDKKPVTINNVNNGNPFGSGVVSNPQFYINNDLSDGGGSINTEMDGLTTVLTCEASVTPNATNHMKLAIADASDSSLDSNVFIRAGSLSTEPPKPKNTAPTVSITTPTEAQVVAAGTINLSADLADVDTADLHTCEIDWNNGAAVSAGVVNEVGGAGTCTGSQALAAGVYNIGVTVHDNGTPSLSAVDKVQIIVYDPSAGFVTGGGWIESPVGAYTSNPKLGGKATFGFVSKYKSGATVPTGNTEFQYHMGNLNFNSSSYEWLVISGARAQYKGTGTINGAGDYGFLLTATDGQVTGGGGVDKFRIKIWDKATDTVIYDNQLGADNSEEPTTALGGGSIVIHKSK